MLKIAFLLACMAGILLGMATAGSLTGLLLGLAGLTCSYFSGALSATHMAEEGKI